jgi:hypothetical protein
MECQLVGKSAMLHDRAMTALTYVGRVVAGGDLVILTFFVITCLEWESG